MYEQEAFMGVGKQGRLDSGLHASEKGCEALCVRLFVVGGSPAAPPAAGRVLRGCKACRAKDPLCVAC